MGAAVCKETENQTNKIPLSELDNNQTQNEIPQNPQNDVYSNFEKNMLDMHNTLRIRNGLEPLVWDKALQQKAADWNQFMAQEANGTAVCRNMRHPGTGPNGTEEEVGKFLPNGNGQNLYQSNAVKVVNGQPVPFDSSSPQEAVRKWYDECSIWKKPQPGQQVPDRFLEVGHMTQLLWKDARKVGCSRVGCRDTNKYQGKDIPSQGSIITCHYDRGNVGGQFQTQVPDDIYCKVPNEWIYKK